MNRLTRHQATTAAHDAVAALTAGHHAQAVALSNEALSKGYETAAVYVNLALAHLGLQQYDEAIAASTKAIERKAKFAQAHLVRGDAKLGQGNLFEARKDYTEAVKLDPNASTAYHNLAMIESRLGDPEYAMELLLHSLTPKSSTTPIPVKVSKP